MISFNLSAQEVAILDDIDEVGHGELYDLMLIEADQEKDQIISIDESCGELLKAMRREKRFVKLIIHDGLPRIAEIQGKTKSGRRYLQKLKFS